MESRRRVSGAGATARRPPRRRASRPSTGARGAAPPPGGARIGPRTAPGRDRAGRQTAASTRSQLPAVGTGRTTMSGELAMWLPGPLDAAARAVIDRLAATDDVHSVAIMPDAHLADEVCVGT